MAYSKRTCHYCGFRDIQPNMTQQEIQYKSGSSNTGLSKRTVAGALLGNEKSAKQVGKYLMHPNKRTYKRRRKVWVCNECSKSASGSVGQAIGALLFWGFVGLLIWTAVVGW
jgi:hypothetical protein